MRVLQVSPGYPPDPGGVERHVQEVSQALVRLGHQVTVLALSGVDAADPEPVPDGGRGATPRVVRVPARAVGPFQLPSGLADRVASLARAHDVVHVHNYHSPLPLIALGAVDDVPVLVSPHFHGGGHTPLARMAHPAYRRLFRRRLPRAAGLVFVSAAEQERFVAEFGDQVPGTVVHNGVRPAPRRPEQDPDAVPLVLSVGRLERYKRVDLLLEALAALPPTRRWQAVVVGDGPDLPRLRSRLEQLATGLPALQGDRLLGRVTFRGRVGEAELDRLLGTARVTVTCSEHEAFGMAALDAVAAGCPVLASDIPAHRELTRLAPGWIRLWNPATGTGGPALDGAFPQAGPGGLGALLERALTSPAASARPPALPSWAAAAEQLAARYEQVRQDRATPRRQRRPA